jgi:hypothetical protein
VVSAAVLSQQILKNSGLVEEQIRSWLSDSSIHAQALQEAVKAHGAE